MQLFGSGPLLIQQHLSQLCTVVLVIHCVLLIIHYSSKGNTYTYPTSSQCHRQLHTVSPLSPGTIQPSCLDTLTGLVLLPAASTLQVQGMLLKQCLVNEFDPLLTYSQIVAYILVSLAASDNTDPPTDCIFIA